MNKAIAIALPVLIGAVAGYMLAGTLAKWQPWKKALELDAGTAV